MSHIKTFEDLRDDLWEEHRDLQSYLFDAYTELDDEDRLIIVGRVRAIGSIIEQIRSIIKWSDVE
jgi:hypothetical protein